MHFAKQFSATRVSMMKKAQIVFGVVLFIVLMVLFNRKDNKTHDEWHTFDGKEIVCRVSGCGNRPLYADWDNRFCAEHIDRSKDHSYLYDPNIAQKKVNTTRALTKEEADALRGTGYHGCRPYSAAENAELDAAMATCANCGMHRDINGDGKLCYECVYNKEHGFD